MQSAIETDCWRPGLLFLQWRLTLARDGTSGAVDKDKSPPLQPLYCIHQVGQAMTETGHAISEELKLFLMRNHV